MRVRRVRSLTELSDLDLLVSIAEGSLLSLGNAERLFAEAEKVLASGAGRSYLIIRGVAEEEASKTLILLDAARCPPSEQGSRSQQLGKFYDHMSRMIYSEICKFRPADFRELHEGIERLREEYYLDGPAGFDWIYRNRLLQDREGILYVDYVETEDTRRWDAPNDALVTILTAGPPLPPASLSMARNLRNVGALTALGVAIVARVWRTCVPTAGMKWATFRRLSMETLEEIDRAGLGQAAEPDDVAAVRDNWPFPLWSIDTTKRDVRFEDMKAARINLAARYPEGY